MRIIAVTLAGLLFAIGTTPATAQEQGRCALHIELYSAQELAAEMGRSESWVLQNHRVNLWQRPTPAGKGRKVGELLPGSRALIRSFQLRPGSLGLPVDA